MRKIFSAVLVVVMLATMITVIPTSAADEVPELFISEVCGNSSGWTQTTIDALDTFEFIEITNPTDHPVNLYDYSIVRGDYTTAEDPAVKSVTNANPLSKGNVSTSNHPQDDKNMYPVNPDEAILGPGEVAVIWFYSSNTYASAKYVKGSALTFADFARYWNFSLDEISLLIAVDSNYKAITNQEYFTEDGVKHNDAVIYGATADNDKYGLGGRFYLVDVNANVSYGLIKTEDIEIGTTKIGDCESYISLNHQGQNANRRKRNLMYYSTYNVMKGDRPDISWNFILSTDVSFFHNGKSVEGNIKFVDWLIGQHATPGKLTDEQINGAWKRNEDGSLITDNDGNPIRNEKSGIVNLSGINVPEISKFISAAYDYDPAKSIEYTVYQQNFFGKADSTDTEAILRDLGWVRTLYWENGGTAQLSIKDERLICSNLGDGAKDTIFEIVPSIIMEKIAKSDYTIEFDLEYLRANHSDRYVTLIYNFNSKNVYDTFNVRVRGSGANQRFIGDNLRTATYDSSGVYNAANTDSSAANTSIVNKITGGEVKAGASSNKAEDMVMLNRTVNIRYEIVQDGPNAGPNIYVNNVLVSKLGENFGTIFWGFQPNLGNFAVGLYGGADVEAAIDNIKVTGYVNNYTEEDLIRAYQNSDSQEPPTGDITFYVVIAMVVSLVSLASLVVVKRKKSVK